jgi:hypothetical protein
MKKAILCITLLGIFSCSSAPKAIEPAIRDVSSSIEDQKIIEVFKAPYVEFNNKAYAIQQKAILKLKNFESNPDVKSCRADSLAKRFFTNACTSAVELCKKNKMSSFTDLDGAFVSSIYSTGISLAKYSSKLAKENKSEKYYQNINALAEHYLDRMENGRKEIIDSYFDTASLMGFEILFSGNPANTYDKQDDFLSCAARLSAHALSSGEFDLWKAKYAQLIPK